MPAEARGHVRKLPSGKWQLRWYDREGRRRSGGAFPTRSEALRHYRDVIESELNGAPPRRRDVTLRELADTFLARHVASDRTIATLRHRLARPLGRFGDVPVVELERMGDELAAFEATLPERFRYAVMSALRQTFRAGVAYGYLSSTPVTWKNPQPAPRGIRIYTDAEIKKLAKDLGPTWGPMIRFAAATGLRPDEWARLERPDVDKRRRVVSVRGTKTARSRREVPLTRAALEAVEAIPARIDTLHLFPNADGGPLNLNGFRRREWGPAVDAAGVAKPARLYDLRSTFASNPLAHGVTVYELARIMDTSVTMIEAHYGALLDTAYDAILERLENGDESVAGVTTSGT
jgi:integrase